VTFVLASISLMAIPTLAADLGKAFATPDEAASALVAASRAKDNPGLHAIFGPAGADMENADRIQATNELSNFTEAYDQSHRLIHESDSRVVLEVGEDHWPFPVPIVKKGGQWFFDSDAGESEIYRRRIGKNELSTLDVMRAYVGAQREYASRDRDGDSVLEYAQKITSSPGKTDGLFWPRELNGETSPLGPWVAEAQTEGYYSNAGSEEAEPQPFHGYFFKILTRQGKNAPGGKYDYIINGNMIGGFALVAWPADYGDSGVMTFIVNQQGQVYQKDLGEKTSRIVKKMREYDPDPSWHPSPD
jgi:hypothetical protein